MGFLDKMRMSTLTQGMTGTPYSDIPKGIDPMMEVINQYQNLLAQQPMIGNIANTMPGVAPPTALPVAPTPMNMVLNDKGNLSEFQKRSLELRARGMENTKDNQEANRDLAGKRVSLAELKARNPNKRFTAVRGGNIMVFDPSTGEFEDSGISSGMLTDADRSELIDDRQTQGIRDRAANTESLEKVRQRGRTALQEDRQAHDTTLEGTRQGNRVDLKTTPGPLREMLPTQRAAEIKNRVQAAIAKNPDWEQHLSADGTIAAIGNGYGVNDLTEAKRNEIYNAIYGDSPAPSTSTITPVTPETEVEPEAKILEKEIPGTSGKMAISMDGGKTWKAK